MSFDARTLLTSAFTTVMAAYGLGQEPSGSARAVDPTLSPLLRVTRVALGVAPRGNMVPVEIELTTDVPEALTAYTVALSAQYADGSRWSTDVGEDLLESQVAVQHGLTVGPDAVIERGKPHHLKAQVRPDKEGYAPISVRSEVRAIVYVDGTARGDAKSLNIISELRANNIKYYSDLLEIVRSGDADPGFQRALASVDPSAPALFRKAASGVETRYPDNQFHTDSQRRRSNLDLLAFKIRLGRLAYEAESDATNFFWRRLSNTRIWRW